MQKWKVSIVSRFVTKKSWIPDIFFSYGLGYYLQICIFTFISKVPSDIVVIFRETPLTIYRLVYYFQPNLY